MIPLPPFIIPPRPPGPRPVPLKDKLFADIARAGRPPGAPPPNPMPMPGHTAKPWPPRAR